MRGRAVGAIGIARTTRRAALAWLVIGASTYFVTAIVLLHTLRPDVSAAASVTSEYAIGPYGFLMTSAYFAFSIALVALAAGLARELSDPARGLSGIALLLLAALATATAGVFPVDVGAPRPVTPTGWTHRIAAIIAFASMSLAPLLLTRPFRRHPGWEDLAWIGRIAGVTGLAGLAAIQLYLLERGLAGAAQRVVLAAIVTWILASAFRLARESGQSVSEPTGRSA